MVATSRSSSLVIRKPESTKNTSTPTNPPEKRAILAWNKHDDHDRHRSQALDVGPKLVVDGHARSRHPIPPREEH